MDESGTYALIGLGYSAVMELLETEDGSAIGTAQGAIKRNHKALPRFVRSADASVGSDFGNVDAINFRDSSESISDPITLKTGIRDPDYGVNLDYTYGRDSNFYLESSNPLPCNVASVSVEGVTND